MAIAKWIHLFPSRTQKLSTSTATIVGRAPAKIASCWVFFMSDPLSACEPANRQAAGSFFYAFKIELKKL